MAVSIEWKELFPWVGTFVAAAVASLIWLARRKKEAKEFRDAESCLRNGQYLDCIRHLSKADEKWAFNVANSTPKTIVRDFDRLIAIVEMITDAAAKSGISLDSEEFLKLLKEARGIASDKSHYKFGTFTLKKEFAAKAGQLASDISEHRSDFRAKYSKLLA